MSTQAQTRRRESRQLIEHMLSEREEMLVLLWKVSGRDADGDHQPEAEALRQFLTILVDYIASAHFGLYRRLAEGRERRQAVVNKAAEVYPLIVQTTDAAMAFNDKYGDRKAAHEDPDLPNELSALAEQLVDRIALEDEVIEAMLGVTVESLGA